jgi:hypothetical protein
VAWRQRDEECGPARSGGVRERDSDPEAFGRETATRRRK